MDYLKDNLDDISLIRKVTGSGQFVIDMEKELIDRIGDNRSVSDLMKELKYTLRVEQSRRLNPLPHPCVSVECDSGECIDIDVEIVDLIKLIWKSGIDTRGSCQDNIPSGYIWIYFSHVSEMNRFYNVIFRGLDMSDDISKDIYKRAVHHIASSPNAWVQNLNFDNRLESGVITEVIFQSSIRFPRSDYDFVLSRFRKFVEGLEDNVKE
jgi:hypothetical protein